MFRRLLSRYRSDYVPRHRHTGNDARETYYGPATAYPDRRGAYGKNMVREWPVVRKPRPR